MKNRVIQAMLAVAISAAAVSTVATAQASTVRPAARSHAVEPAAGTAEPIPALSGLTPVRAPRGAGRVPARLQALAGAGTYTCYAQAGLRSLANLLWITPELGYTGYGYGMLRARATTVGPWEQYNLYCSGVGRNLVIQSRANGLYVSTEIGDSGIDYAVLRARARVVGPWEQYINTEQFC